MDIEKLKTAGFISRWGNDTAPSQVWELSGNRMKLVYYFNQAGSGTELTIDGKTNNMTEFKTIDEVVRLAWAIGLSKEVK